MPLPRESKNLPFAKKLRHDMTEQERKLWYLYLRGHPKKFYKQKIIGPYIVDFYCNDAKLVIEIDGSQHYYDEESREDMLRSDALASMGVRVIRFSNREVDREFRNVCDAIELAISQLCK